MVCSTLAAETMAMVESAGSALNLSALIKVLHPETKHPIPIEIYTDNKSPHDTH